MMNSVGGTLAIASAIYLFYRKRQAVPLPPTAPGYLPVIGHLLQVLRPVPVYELFRQWSMEVGPVFTCYFGTQRWVVLNSVESIKDLIVDRSKIYSSRNLPDTLVHDLMQGDEGGSFAFLPYGSNWRRLRRIAHGGLVKSKIDIYQPILDDRRTTFLSYLYDLCQTKSNDQGVSLAHLIEHYTMTSILTIAYGDMCSFEPGDPVLHNAFTLTERAASTMSPADQIREFFPVLKKIWPIQRGKYLRVRDDFTSFYGTLLKDFKVKLSQGETQDCFVKAILESGELTDLQIQHFVGLFVGAGSDTTTATLEWMIAFLANHPEVQDKVFEEIKHNVGLDRLPTASDEYNLPYLQCVILETLRLRAPAPIAIPHSTTQEDVYKNWVIPEDTVVVMNLYAIHTNAERYPNPHSFLPERHMPYVEQQDHRVTQGVQDRPHLSFSTGRRVCVGIHLAERSLFMAASMLLSCFKFERVSEALIDVNTPRDIRAPTWIPCDYRVRLVPRHEQVKNFVS